MRTLYKILFCFVLILSTPIYAEEIIIGSILPLSGPLAVIGQGSKRGIEIASKEINERWNPQGNSFKVIFEDSQGEPAKAVSAFTSLKPKINYPAVYTSLTSVAQAIKPLTKSAQILQFAESGHPQITEGSNFILRNFTTSKALGTAAVDYIKKNNIQNISFLQAEEEWAEGIAEEIKKAESANFKVGAIEKISKNELDVKSVLMRLKAKNPDSQLLLIALLEAVESNAIIQAKQLGFDTILATYVCTQPNVLQSLKNVFDGQVTVDMFVENSNSPEYTAFKQMYRKMYSSDFPEVHAAAAYDTIKILADAIEHNNSSADDLRSYIVHRDLCRRNG